VQTINKFYLLVLILFISCQNNTSDIQEFVEQEFPVEIIEDAELIHTEFGKIKVKISAKKIERFINSNPRLVFTDSIVVIFFDRNSDTLSNLQANKALINETENLMHVSDNVILISSNGNKLETNHLSWDEKKEKIFTEENVIITTDKEVINAQGFVSDPDFIEYSLHKVNGVLSFNN
jgi:LPS export ABC transporter protein LptC|tara:strand:+ start:3311 stop:3844 length:534 start_codon:yes stop_codon:yes gene_type:complete